MSKSSPAAALIERSKHDIGKVRILATTTVFCHSITAITMMIMAFSKSETLGDFSTTVVLCAFGGLIAVLWSSVAAYEVLSAPRVTGHRTLPKWEWHNRHFALAVGTVFLDTMCLLPACFLFVLHWEGQDVFSLLSQFDVAVAHVVIAVLLGVVQVVSIVHFSRQLHRQQDALEAHTSTALPLSTRCLVAAKVILDWVFLITLLVIACQVGGNSGPILCVISACATRSVFVLFLYQLYKGLSAEAFLTRWREFCIIQCFFTYGEFWISFVVYLLRKGHDQNFFSSVNNMPGSRRALVGVALTTMLCSIIIYGLLLFYHARCMVALDTMGGLARLDAGDSVANLYATARLTRVTAVEMPAVLQEHKEEHA